MIQLTPEQIAALPAADQAWVLDALEQQALLSSPAAFGSLKSSFTAFPHIHYISDAIVGMVERDECDILVVEVSVRHGKSWLCSQVTPAWFLCKYPEKYVGLAAYGDDFAKTHGRAARNLVEAVGGRFGVTVDSRSSAADRWEITDHGGGMWTAGAGGQITGKGYHLGIVDDPIKTAEEAYSQYMRDKLWEEWWQPVWLTRRTGTSPKIVVVMSRWHEDDLVGRIKQTMNQPGQARVRVIHLPAVAEEGDEMGRRPGDALCPELISPSLLSMYRETSGKAWASLYQQRPQLEDGGVFKREMFRYWRRNGENTLLEQPNGTVKLADTDQMFTFCTMDTAYTRNKRSDYTVLAKWGIVPADEAPALLLLDLWRVKVESTEHLPMILQAWGSVPKPTWIGVERQNATLSLLTDARRKGVLIRELRPDKSKPARAETAAAFMGNGRVYFPKGAPWLEDVEAELLGFPTAAHDDVVDVLSYAAIEVNERRIAPKRKKSPEPSTPDERMAAYLKNRSGSARTHEVLGRF